MATPTTPAQRDGAAPSPDLVPWPLYTGLLAFIGAVTVGGHLLAPHPFDRPIFLLIPAYAGIGSLVSAIGVDRGRSQLFSDLPAGKGRLLGYVGVCSTLLLSGMSVTISNLVSEDGRPLVGWLALVPTLAVLLAAFILGRRLRRSDPESW